MAANGVTLPPTFFEQDNLHRPGFAVGSYGGYS
jgi:hypothetical protein